MPMNVANLASRLHQAASQQAQQAQAVGREALKEASQQVEQARSQFKQAVSHVADVAERRGEVIERLTSAPTKPVAQRPVQQVARQVKPLIDRAKRAMQRIVGNPLAFVKHLAGAVKRGFTRFTGNIAKHLVKGPIRWLAGAMKKAGVALPKRFDVKGVMKLGLNVLGVTARRVGDKINKVAKALNPVGAIVKTVKTIYDVATQGPKAVADAAKRVARPVVDAAKRVARPLVDAVKNSPVGKLLPF